MKQFLLTVSLVIALAVQSFGQAVNVQRNAITTNVVPLIAGTNMVFTTDSRNHIILNASASSGGGVQFSNYSATAIQALVLTNGLGTEGWFDNFGQFGFGAVGTQQYFTYSYGGPLTLSGSSFNITNTASTDPITVIGTMNNYFELFLQNLSAGAHASTDFVMANDKSSVTDTNYILDGGINSSGNTDNIVGNPNEAYLYAGGFVPSLNIWATGATNAVRFGAGGVSTNNEVFRITPGGATFTGAITNNTLTATSVTGADANKKEVSLTLAGGLSITGTTLSGAGITNAGNIAYLNGTNIFTGTNTFTNLFVYGTGQPAVTEFGGSLQTNLTTGNWSLRTNGTITLGPTNAGANITLNGVTGSSLFQGPETNLSSLTVQGAFIPEGVTPTSIPVVNSATNLVAATLAGGLSITGTTLTAAGATNAGNIAFLNGTNAFTGTNQFVNTTNTGNLAVAGSVLFSGAETNLSSLTVQGALKPEGVTPSSFVYVDASTNLVAAPPGTVLPVLDGANLTNRLQNFAFSCPGVALVTGTPIYEPPIGMFAGNAVEARQRFIISPAACTLTNITVFSDSGFPSSGTNVTVTFFTNGVSCGAVFSAILVGTGSASTVSTNTSIKIPANTKISVQFSANNPTTFSPFISVNYQVLQ